jgi:hypothetical protein
MTDLELRTAKAFKSVTFGVATASKRFAKTLMRLSDEAPATPLSEKQHAFMLTIAYHYRRQIADSELVQIATEHFQQSKKASSN